MADEVRVDLKPVDRGLARELDRVEKELRAMDRQLDRTTRSMRQADRQVETLAGGLKRLRQTAIGAGVAIGAAYLARAMAEFARAGVAFNRQIETATIQFKAFTGSAASAERHVKSLAQFAAATPFQLTQIATASRMLKTFGADAAFGAETLRVIGDAAAGVSQPFEAVAMWFGRMYDAIQAGRPFGEASQRLQEMGLLSGAARAELERLSAEGGDAVGKLEEVFGKFDGSMKDLSETTAGLESTFSDLFDQFAGGIVEVTGLGDAYKFLLEQTNAMLTDTVKLLDAMREIPEVRYAVVQAIGRMLPGVGTSYMLASGIAPGSAADARMGDINLAAPEAPGVEPGAGGGAVEAIKRTTESIERLASSASRARDAAFRLREELYELEQREIANRPRASIDRLASSSSRARDAAFRLREELYELDQARADEAMERAAEKTLMALDAFNELGKAVGGFEGRLISAAASIGKAFATGGPIGGALAAGLTAVKALTGWWRRKSEEMKRASEEARRYRAEIQSLSREMQGLPSTDRQAELARMAAAYAAMTQPQRDATAANDEFVQSLIDAVAAGERLPPVLLDIIRNSDLLGQTIGRLQDRLDFLEEERALRDLNRQAQDLQRTFDAAIERIDAMRDAAQAFYDLTIKQIDREADAARDAYDAAMDRLDERRDTERDAHEAAMRALDAEADGIRDLMRMETVRYDAARRELSEQAEAVRDLMRADKTRHDAALRAQRERTAAARAAERSAAGIPGVLRTFGLNAQQLGGGIFARQTAFDFQTFATEIGSLLQAGADPGALLRAGSTADPRNTIAATLGRGVEHARQTGGAVPEQLRALVEAAGLGAGVRYGSGLTPEQEALAAEEERERALAEEHRQAQAAWQADLLRIQEEQAALQVEHIGVQAAFQSELIAIQERREAAAEEWRVKQAGWDAQRAAIADAWEETQKGFEQRREAAESTLESTLAALEAEAVGLRTWFKTEMKPIDEARNAIMLRREQRQEAIWTEEETRHIGLISILTQIGENTGNLAPGVPAPLRPGDRGVNPTPLPGDVDPAPGLTELPLPAPSPSAPVVNVRINMNEDRRGKWRLKQVAGALGDTQVIA